MEIKELRKLIKDCKGTDELVLWEWREDDFGTRSYYWDLTPTMDPKRHKGYIMLMENKYVDEIRLEK